MTESQRDELSACTSILVGKRHRWMVPPIFPGMKIAWWQFILSDSWFSLRLVGAKQPIRHHIMG